MATKGKLSDIIQGMEFQGEETSNYFNKKTCQIIAITDEFLREAEDALEESKEDSFVDRPEWQHDCHEECREFLEHRGEFVQLPTKFDIHEYRIMEDFCREIDNPQHASRLSRAIQGSGAFRRFKDSIRELGIVDRWDRFREAAMKEIAVEWCEDNGIECIDDVVLPDEGKILAEKKTKAYAELESQLRALLEGETDPIANAANAAALLYHSLPDVNWAGFYYLRDGELILGPFQGRPACVRIPLGKGVCGTAAKDRKTLIVPDVEKFPGHIACDAASKSEIVVPLIQNARLLGVLDLDSPLLNRFDEIDRAGLEKVAEVLILRM